MKNQRYNTVVTLPRSNRKKYKEAKSKSLTYNKLTSWLGRVVYSITDTIITLHNASVGAYILLEDNVLVQCTLEMNIIS